MSTRRRQELMVFIRPSTPDHPHPLTAYIGGTQIEATGETVLEAVQQLFATKSGKKVAGELEALIVEAGWRTHLSRPA